MGKFMDYFRDSFEYLTDTSDEPGISYYTEIFGDKKYSAEDLSGIAIEEISRMLAGKITERTNEECVRGMSVVGPHRDDYIFSLKKNTGGTEKRSFEIKNFASQGEHKTFVIALKLAEYHFMKDVRGSLPVLLLDDLLSELDSVRVSKIVSHLKDYGQIFLTTTDTSYLNELKNFYAGKEISLFKVVKGQVE